jgi:hypothetical protein
MSGRFVGIVVVTVLVLVLTACVSSSATTFASPVDPSPTPDPDLPDVAPMEDYVAAVGVGSIITLLIQIFKALGWVPDGQAGRWATTANVVAFAGLWIAGAFGFAVASSPVQNILSILEQGGKLVLMVITSPVFFEILRDAKVIGDQ